MNDRNDMSDKDAMNGVPDDPLMAAAAALTKDIRPQRDLWPGIEQALMPKRSAGWLRNGIFAQAASVLLLVGASSGLTYLAVSKGGSEVSPVSPEVTRVFEPVSGSFGSRYNLGPDFQDARDVLAARLDLEMQKLSPDSRAEIQKNLDTIRAAIVEINKALAAEPDNVLLQDLLIRTYHDELQLMQKVGGIRNSAMLRNDI
jgi:hypothetical protein